MTGTDVVADRGKRQVRSAIGPLAVLVVVVWSGVCPAQVLNPSFETTFTVTGRPPAPTSWWRVNHSSFSWDCTDAWSTDGDLSAVLLSLADKTFSAGDHQSFFQVVDLTGISSIVFDVALTADPEGVFEHFEASFLIDGVPVWSEDMEGFYYNQQVSILGLSDWHFIELRLTALDAGVFDVGYCALWDNVRLMEESMLIPAVIDLDPGTLNLQSNGKWITCYIELPEGGNVLEIEGATVTLTLDGISACVDDGRGWATTEAHEGNITDHDGDGIAERMVKFSREAVQAIVQPPQTTVTIQGYLTDGTLFEGTAVLRVLDKGGKKK